ncbi:phospholipase D family protein [Candidatus Micrarchaeota archaeon]|nr:phospholipase D family protein [Candidatus Micrarchaeota archaeon]MBD3418011.1 phospholipase D family protein [Candidatus Micrarchaeota archaeon]
MNRDFLAGLFAGAFLFLLLAFLFLPAYSVSVVSSPGAEDEILSLIDSARHSIYIDMYILTSEKVVDSLVSAHYRGVDVKVILEERTGANYLAFSRLEGAGASVCWASDAYKLSHPKLIIVDSQAALVGSHNLSNSALNSNREISLLVQGNVVSALISLFDSDWAACAFP